MLRGYWSYLCDYVSEKNGIDADSLLLPPPYNNRVGKGRGFFHSPNIDRREVVVSKQQSQHFPGVLHHQQRIRHASPLGRKQGQSQSSNFDRVLHQRYREAPTGFRKEQLSEAFSTTFLIPESAMPSSSSFGPPAGRSVHFASHSMVVVSEEDCLAAIQKGSRSMTAVLEHRQRALMMCQTAWRNRGPIAAMELAGQMDDPSVVVDLLNILNFRSNIWKLDLCVAVLPQLRQLLDSKYEPYVHTAVNSLSLVLRGFGQIIKNGIQAGHQVPSIGVDISQEERISKCQKCYNELAAIRESVQRKTKAKGDIRGGRNAHPYRQLALMMNSLDV